MLSPRLLNIPKHFRQTPFSTDARATDLRRSYLYVPSSSDRKLNKSLETSSDVIIYDLEDSVPPSPTEKTAARTQLSNFLLVWTRNFFLRDIPLQALQQNQFPNVQRNAVRINDVTTPFFRDDVQEIVCP